MNIIEMAISNAYSAFDYENEYSSIWLAVASYNKNAIDTLGDYGIDTEENRNIVNNEFMQRVIDVFYIMTNDIFVATTKIIA